MNCNCGRCNICLSANPSNFGTPTYNGGISQPIQQPISYPPQLPTFEQYQKGMHVTAAPIGTPSVAVMGETIQPTQTPPILENGGVAPVDEWVFKNMTPWEILFWSLPDPEKPEITEPLTQPIV